MDCRDFCFGGLRAAQINAGIIGGRSPNNLLLQLFFYSDAFYSGSTNEKKTKTSVKETICYKGDSCYVEAPGKKK